MFKSWVISLEHTLASDWPLADRDSGPGTGGWFFLKRPEIWVAIVLWVASNAFVTGFTKFANWEGAASYSSIADLCKWDCTWYVFVVESGYDRIPQRDRGDRANWPFPPVFPLTAYPLHYWLGIPTAKSLVVASKAALLLAIYGFLLMVHDQTETTADRFRAGSLVAFNPYLIYAHAGYTEPLYFALLAFAIYFAGQRRWIASGAMGALLSATRIVGFLYSVSYAVMWLRDLGWRCRLRKLNPNRLIGFLFCPLGMAVLMLYMHHHTGDALAPIHIQVAWVHTVSNPFRVLWESLKGSQWPRIWGVMTFVGLTASAWLFKLRKPELGIYLALSILMPLSATYASMARYIWWQPPFLFAIYRALERHAEGWVMYLAFTSGMASFMVLAWFTGNNFVV